MLEKRAGEGCKLREKVLELGYPQISVPTSSWELLLWAEECLSQTLESWGGVSSVGFLAGVAVTLSNKYSCGFIGAAEDSSQQPRLGKPDGLVAWLRPCFCHLPVGDLGKLSVPVSLPHTGARKMGPRSELVHRLCLSEYLFIIFFIN